MILNITKKVAIALFLISVMMLTTFSQISGNSSAAESIDTASDSGQNKIIYFSAGFGMLAGAIIADQTSARDKGIFLPTGEHVKGALIGLYVGAGFGYIINKFVTHRKKPMAKTGIYQNNELSICPNFHYNQSEKILFVTFNFQF